MNQSTPFIDSYPATQRGTSFLIYWTIITIIALTITLIPFIYLEVGVTTTGIIRPTGEKVSLRPIVPGTIDSIFCKEGEYVPAGAVIFSITNISSTSKALAIETELVRKKKLNQDLLILCKSNLSDPHILSKLITPVLAMQLGEYKNQSTARNITFKKSAYELSVAQNLFNDSVISANEYFAHRDENSRLSAEYEAFKISWKSKWEQQLLTLNSEITDLEKQQELLVRENQLYLVRAPSSGILMGVNDKYPGLFIQAGELFGELSPETSLIAECIVDPSSIGMIRNHQRVTMQIDAFDHTYFGSVNGTVSSIDNDYTMMHQSPVYKVRCTIDENTLRLKNGYEAKLKKGLTFQARFIVAKRSVFDLLFDNIDDWLNPGRR